MNFQNTIAKLESVKGEAFKIERNTASFYQHWQKGVSMAMKGNLEIDLGKHSAAYIEGQLDAISFIEVQYFNRIYNNLSKDELMS